MSAPFRLNPQVVQMLAVVLVALAVPLTVVILGLRQVSLRPSGPAPEIPELRASLEQVADQHLRPSGMMAGEAIVLHRASAELPDVRRQIEVAAAKVGGSVIVSEIPEGGVRLLVKVPASSAGDFENSALPQNPSTAPGPGLYEIQILSKP